jgi:hypothetical protein
MSKTLAGLIAWGSRRTGTKSRTGAEGVWGLLSRDEVTPLGKEPAGLGVSREQGAVWLPDLFRYVAVATN